MREASSRLVLTVGVSTRELRSREGTVPAPVPLPAAAGREATVRAYAERWLEGIRGQVRPRTLAGYRAQLDRHVIPRLGERLVVELDADDLLQLIRELRGQGYTGWTIRTILTPLSRLLSHAVRRGVIPVNPMNNLDRTERPAVWIREQRTLNSEEIARLLGAAPPRYRTLLAAAVFTGLRQSELLALRWENIDFADEVVHVQTALDRSGRHVEPKTRNARRDVVLMPALSRALKTLKASSPYPAPTDYVFVSQVGTPLYWRNVARRALQPALRNAGIEHVRWHDLRHTFASLLIASGANISFVSRQLGHGSPDITLRVYGHLFDRAEHAQRTRDVLESTFGAIV